MNWLQLCACHVLSDEKYREKIQTMNRFGILRLKFLGFAVLMLMAVASADAYVLKGEHLVQLMVSATNLPRRFLVRQQISIVDQAIHEPAGSGEWPGEGSLNGLTGRRDKGRAETRQDPPPGDLRKDSDGFLNAMLTGSLMDRLFESDQYPSAESMAAEYLARREKTYKQLVRYELPGHFRSDITSEDLTRIHLASANQALTVVDGRIISEGDAWEDRYKDIFLYRSRKQMVEKLESCGINFSVTSLGRYDQAICFIIGAQYPDESVPQIWLDKETFRPVRWIVESSGNQEKPNCNEILYRTWTRHSGAWYPSEIAFFKDGVRMRTITVTEVMVNPDFSDDLFDLAKLKSIYLNQAVDATKNPDSKIEESDIEQRIMEFKQIYE